MPDPFKSHAMRAAMLGASFVATAGVMLVVVLPFDRASSESWLRDSTQARAAMSECSAEADRLAQRACRRQVLAAARAQDAGITHMAVNRALASSP